jgi:hypothetical protein
VMNKPVAQGCRARAGNTGANDPQDCDFPDCGCDVAAREPLKERAPLYMPTMDEVYRFIKSNPVTSAEILAEVLDEKWTEERHAAAPPEQRQGGAK